MWEGFLYLGKRLRDDVLYNKSSADDPAFILCLPESNGQAASRGMHPQMRIPSGYRTCEYVR